MLLEKLHEDGIDITDSMTLYTTMEPNIERTFTDDYKDCATLIIDAGIKNVVYGARSEDQHERILERMQEAGVDVTQVSDDRLVDESGRLFNETDKSGN